VNYAAHFDVDPGYLNTASLGAPPRATAVELDEILEGWRHGRLNATDFDEHVTRARSAWAKISAVEPENVAIGASASSLIGIVAASLPNETRVLIAEGDFTSVIFPFLVQARRGVTIREVPLSELIESIDDSVDLVAVSAVQSSDGRRVDLDQLAQRANTFCVKVLLDTTQSCGWLPLDGSRFDYTVCAAYKWLLSPRGVAFMSVQPQSLGSLVPHAANWYAGEDIWNSIYGSPLRLAERARRLDTSPAWFSWVGAATSLEFLAQLDTNHIYEHNVALANSLLAKLGLPAQDSAIITLEHPNATELLKRAGVRTAVRAGKVRASFHLYNDEEDVDMAVLALT